jgi:hypothetical protein
MTDQRPAVARADTASEFARGEQLGPVPVRRTYATPRLNTLGDLRDLTLGGSIGRADSGAPRRQSRVGGL